MDTVTDRLARQQRAEARRFSLVGRLIHPAHDVPPVGRTIEERLEMVAEISERAWALTGRPVPTWTRGEIPGRIIRGGDGG